jgi:hypothetical protein
VASDYPAFDAMNTGNNLEIKREAEERIFYKVAKVHNVLEV